MHKPCLVMSKRYDVRTDDVIRALIAEAVSDSDMIGLVLTGSRAVGDVTPESVKVLHPLVEASTSG